MLFPERYGFPGVTDGEFRSVQDRTDGRRPRCSTRLGLHGTVRLRAEKKRIFRTPPEIPVNFLVYLYQ